MDALVFGIGQDARESCLRDLYEGQYKSCATPRKHLPSKISENCYVRIIASRRLWLAVAYKHVGGVVTPVDNGMF